MELKIANYMEPTPLKKYGLIPEAIPRNRPTTHQVFGSPALPDLPRSLMLPDPIGPVDQKDTSICFAYATRQLCSSQDGIAYDENWNVAAIGEQYGSSVAEGAPALVAMQAMVSRGPLRLSDAPTGMTWEEKGVDFIADIRNWDAADNLKAAPNEKTSVLAVDGPYDDFDNARAFMSAHNRPVALATKWYAAFNEPQSSGFIPDALLASIKTPGIPFTWHMYEAMGFDVIDGKDVMVVKPHEGAGYGKDGLAYFDRDTIDFLVEDPLACGLAFGDVPTSVVSRLMVQNLSLEEIFAELAARVEARI